VRPKAERTIISREAEGRTTFFLCFFINGNIWKHYEKTMPIQQIHNENTMKTHETKSKHMKPLWKYMKTLWKHRKTLWKHYENIWKHMKTL